MLFLAEVEADVVPISGQVVQIGDLDY